MLVDFGSFIMKSPPLVMAPELPCSITSFDLEFFLNLNLYRDPLLLCRLSMAAPPPAVDDEGDSAAAVASAAPPPLLRLFKLPDGFL